MKKKLLFLMLLIFSFSATISLAQIPEGYASIYVLQGEPERAPLQLAEKASVQLAGPGANWHLVADWDFSDYENLAIHLTFDPEDAGKQVALRFSINLSAVHKVYFTLPTEGTNYSAVVNLRPYAVDGKVGLGGMVFYNGTSHWALDPYPGTPATKPLTINYVAVGPKINVDPDPDPDPVPVVVNLIPTGNFEGITSVQDNGWALLNGDASKMQLLASDNTLDASSTQMLKLVASAGTNAWSLQLRTPAATIIPENRYVFSFDIRSEGVGKGRISLSAAGQFKHQYWPDFNTDANWKTISFATIYGDSLIALGDQFIANFDLGYVADMVYYIDNVRLIDLTAPVTDPDPDPDPDPVVVNLIPKGDFEGITSVQAEGWSLLNGDATKMELLASDNTLDASSTKMLKLVTPATATNAWDLQLRTAAATIIPGNKYVFSFDIRSEGVGKGRISLSAANQFKHQYWPDFNTDTNWKTFTYEAIYGDSLIALGNQFIANFDLGYVAGMVYYLDNVKLIDVTPAVTPVTELAVKKVLDGTITDDADYKIVAFMRWDADNVYIDFEINDDVLYTEAANAYESDNIEIYFDLDNSKNIKWPRNAGWMANDPTYDANDFQFRILPGKEWAAYNTKVAGVVLTTTMKTGGYDISVKIPWATLKEDFTPTAGSKIGFDILASDNDNDRRNQVSWYSISTMLWNDPSHWGTLEFVADGTFVSVPDVTAPDKAVVTATVEASKVTLAWGLPNDNIAVWYYDVKQDGVVIKEKIYAKQNGETFVVNNLADGTYKFTVVTYDNSGNSSSADIDVVINTTSVVELNADFKVYPNPSNGIVNILSGSNTTSVLDVFNMSGQRIMRKSFANNCSIDLSGFSSGIYILKVTTDNKVNTTRLSIR
jgi:hypothetical protein